MPTYWVKKGYSHPFQVKVVSSSVHARPSQDMGEVNARPSAVITTRPKLLLLCKADAQDESPVAKASESLGKAIYCGEAPLQHCMLPQGRMETTRWLLLWTGCGSTQTSLMHVEQWRMHANEWQILEKERTRNNLVFSQQVVDYWELWLATIRCLEGSWQDWRAYIVEAQQGIRGFTDYNCRISVFKIVQRVWWCQEVGDVMRCTVLVMSSRQVYSAHDENILKPSIENVGVYENLLLAWFI